MHDPQYLQSRMKQDPVSSLPASQLSIKERNCPFVDYCENEAAYIHLVDILTGSDGLNGKLWSFKSIMHDIYSVQQLGNLVMHNMTHSTS